MFGDKKSFDNKKDDELNELKDEVKKCNKPLNWIMHKLKKLKLSQSQSTKELKKTIIK